MGLIDMRTRPDAINDKTYRWILQLKDDFTKFYWAKPDDHEFINALTNSLQTDFPSKILHNTFYE